MASDVENLFMYLSAIYIPFSMICLCMSLVHFLNGLLFFLIVEFWEFCIYPKYESFVRQVVCNYLLPVNSLSFHPLNQAFSRTFNGFFWNLIYQFFLLWIMLWCHAWESLPSSRFCKISPITLSKSFILTFTFTAHYELISV